ncbi:hypothetical protein [Salisediminibacterium halotolerans]|uniref:Chromosome segregation ATPase n=1 Tax=Salisediminibacterium halotolerans TaxID=517425 RepID=A0A1H9SZR7_9BACI|nr:hypothetical protein [Salisediminibacterium haloalkalitolerans]SER90264.1 hypothetical protein SAMN05444126_10877 [Salisediminibacterium haloalkalitolerans]
MPAISKIRFTNVVYEEGMKRYNDELFRFDGYNGGVVLENGGGKTVFIQAALQAVLPHADVAGRKMKQTLQLDGAPAHVAIEWIISEQPRRYLVTCVTLFLRNNTLDSLRYTYEYGPDDLHSIEGLPLVRDDGARPADRGEMSDYYQQMNQQSLNAQTYTTLQAFRHELENQYHIISKEWESIITVNSAEGGVEAFFDGCKQTSQLFDRLLIPTVENAVAGEHQDSFLSTFEKHREQFKLYQTLKRRIEELTAVEQKLKAYTETFAAFEETRTAYEAEKSRTKGYFQLLQKDQAAVETERADVDAQLKQWEAETSRLERRRKSLNIAEYEAAMQDANNTLAAESAAHADANETVAAYNHEYYSIQLVQQQQKYETAKELAANIESSIARFDEESTDTEITEALEANAQELKGYFEQEASKRNREIDRITWQIQPLEAQITSETAQLATVKSDEQDTRTTYDRKTGSIESLQAELVEERQYILSNPEHESVEHQLSLWNERLDTIDQDQVTITNQNRKRAETMSQKQEQLNAAREAITTRTGKLQAGYAALEQMEKAHEEVVQVLAEVQPKWQETKSLYLQQHQMEKALHDKEAQAEKAREKALIAERQARRAYDDYYTQDVFFADSHLSKRLEQLTNAFSTIETGVQFIQSLHEDVDVYMQRYPSWPTTLITTAKEKEALTRRIEGFKEELQFPIEVISIEEAKALAHETVTEASSLLPTYWEENVHTASFRKWQNEAAEAANTAANTLAAREAEKNLIVQARKRLYQFLQTYPYEDRKAQEEAVHALEAAQESAYHEISGLEHELKQFEAAKSGEEKRLHELQNEAHGLSDLVRRAKTYMEKSRRLTQLESEKQETEGRLARFHEARRKHEKQIERLKEEVDGRKADLREAEHALKHVQHDPLYETVQTHHALHTNKTYALLNREREQLLRALEAQSESRSKLISDLEREQEKQAEAEKQIHWLKAEYPDVDDTFPLPTFVDDRLNTLLKRRNEAKAARKKLAVQKQQAEKAATKAEAIYEQEKSTFEAAHPDDAPETFTQPLPQAWMELEEAQNTVEQQKLYFNGEKDRLLNVQADIDTALQALEKLEEAHHFTGPSVLANKPAPEEETAFTYQRGRTAKQLTERLRETAAAVNEQSEGVRQEEQRFKRFTEQTINDFKMQERLIKGVETKTDYPSALRFQEDMSNSIQSSIRYNEKTMRSYDEQLEMFITRVHGHLVTIADELKTIPLKTRVKVDGQWKQIYQFKIPEWSEEDGKARLRDHISWIVDQLDHETYQDEYGQEDLTKVRKDLEKWLASKQLLRKVLNDEAMAVRCRKVMNNHEVTSRSSAWETTNNWSGGERWSKNMTLFLGVLNYIAEKQQPVAQKSVRHRTVILDNPFGAASSDHILSPVFFIAEQLGFQIIALTAHVEGKFLRDYFPVIYSCRLRRAVDGSTQIMTKEKELNRAYFRDHHPRALENLGDAEQLPLFGED